MLTPTKPVKSCECGSPCGDCCGCTKESIGLGNVDNTSDLNKPLSTAMINALSGKVDLDTFTQLKNRVLALENSIPDITDLEHRMDEAEDDILGLNAGYNSLHNTVLSMADSITELGGRVTGVSDGLVTVGTRVDDLEAENSNNVKLRGASEQTIEGKLKANDPIAGATDKTLVTANWVSQTGDRGPNNLVHKTGIETILSTKYFNHIHCTNMHGFMVGYMPGASTGGYKKLTTLNLSLFYGVFMEVTMGSSSAPFSYKRLFVSRRGGSPNRAVIVCIESWAYQMAETSIWAKYNTDGTIDIYAPETNSINTNIYVDSFIYGSGYGGDSIDYTTKFTMVPQSELVHLDSLPADSVEMVKATNFM